MTKTNKELLEELTIKVGRILSFLEAREFIESRQGHLDFKSLLNKGINYDHEKEIDIESEDLQAVHDEDNPVKGECQECGEKTKEGWQTWCAYHYATIGAKKEGK